MKEASRMEPTAPQGAPSGRPVSPARDYDSPHRYDDIIDLPRPVSEKHPPMSLRDRAAQFAPFAALTGYEDAIDETARLTDSPVELTEEAKEALDRRLRRLRHRLEEEDGVSVILTYFIPDLRKEGGLYRTAPIRVTGTDEVGGALLRADGYPIPYDRILDLAWEDETPEPTPWECE